MEAHRAVSVWLAAAHEATMTLAQSRDAASPLFIRDPLSLAAVFLFVAFTQAVALLPRHSTHAAPTINSGVIGMFDVYVRGSSQLLVIRRGAPLPAGLVGGRRQKRAARAVSDEISGAVMREGFYKRSQARVMDAPVDVSQSF
jgi:hypothetical protein